MKRYTLFGEVLSPVHIGSGLEWEPLDYTINSATQKLHRFDIADLLPKMQPEEIEHLNIFNDRGDLNAVKQLITQKANEYLTADQDAGITVTPEIADLYENKIDDIRNQLLISPMIRLKSSQQVYLPGSSLKGAIRTAIVSALAKNSGLAKPNPFGREVWNFEATVLKYRDAKQDPFRAVKIQDAALGSDASIICKVSNVSKNENHTLMPNSIQLILEVTHSKVTKSVYRKSLTFHTELRLDVPLMQQRNAVSQKFSIEQIRDCCNAFYRDKLQMEHEKFYAGSFASEISEQLLNEPFAENEFLLRLGRFSGVESVTLDEYRNPQPPGRSRGWGKSRNIADEKYPMGWLKMQIKEF